MSALIMGAAALLQLSGFASAGEAENGSDRFCGSFSPYFLARTAGVNEIDFVRLPSDFTSRGIPSHATPNAVAFLPRWFHIFFYCFAGLIWSNLVRGSVLYTPSIASISGWGFRR